MKKLASNSVKSIEGKIEKDLDSALDSDLKIGEYEVNDKPEEYAIRNVGCLPVIIAIIALIIFLILIAVLLA